MSTGDDGGEAASRPVLLVEDSGGSTALDRALGAGRLPVAVARVVS